MLKNKSKEKAPPSFFTASPILSTRPNRLFFPLFDPFSIIKIVFFELFRFYVVENLEKNIKICYNCLCKPICKKGLCPALPFGFVSVHSAFFCPHLFRYNLSSVKTAEQAENFLLLRQSRKNDRLSKKR